MKQTEDVKTLDLFHGIDLDEVQAVHDQDVKPRERHDAEPVDPYRLRDVVTRFGRVAGLTDNQARRLALDVLTAYRNPNAGEWRIFPG